MFSFPPEMFNFNLLDIIWGTCSVIWWFQQYVIFFLWYPYGSESHYRTKWNRISNVIGKGKVKIILWEAIEIDRTHVLLAGMWNYYSQTSMDKAFLIAFQEMHWCSEGEASWTFWLSLHFLPCEFYTTLLKLILSAHFDCWLTSSQFSTCKQIP